MLKNPRDDRFTLVIIPRLGLANPNPHLTLTLTLTLALTLALTLP